MVSNMLLQYDSKDAAKYKLMDTFLDFMNMWKVQSSHRVQVKTICTQAAQMLLFYWY